MRILHAPNTVGGNAFTLSRAERQLGHKSDVLAMQKSGFNYPADCFVNISGLPTVRDQEKAIFRFYADAFFRYDVFHFNFGQSLFHYTGGRSRLLEDLRWLRRLKKTVFMTFQGCDLRDRFSCVSRLETSACRECAHHDYCNEAHNKQKHQTVRAVKQFAHHIYVLNPDLLHACPEAEFLPYASVDPREWTPAEPSAGGGPIQILHSPSSRSIKGTDYVMQAVADLQGRGYPVELLLVENVPWTEVKSLYARADVVVDQLLIGWYGGFAVECMAMAKPVLCYLREEDLGAVPFRSELPIVRTSASTLANDLVPLLEDAALRREIGARSRAFVEAHHNPVRIAARVLADYERYGLEGSGRHVRK